MKFFNKSLLDQKDLAELREIAEARKNESLDHLVLDKYRIFAFGQWLEISRYIGERELNQYEKRTCELCGKDYLGIKCVGCAE